MSNTKQCCGNCHWFKNANKLANGTILGNCGYLAADSAERVMAMWHTEGTTCPAFRQCGERLPQRFRYRLVPDGEWSYGVCWWNGRLWHIRTQGGGQSCIKDGEDPTHLIALICLEPHCVEWIDRDYGWEDLPGKDAASS